MLIKYLVENTTKNIGISNFIICEISSKFSIIKYEDMGNDRIIKNNNGIIKPSNNI